MEEFFGLLSYWQSILFSTGDIFWDFLWDFRTVALAVLVFGWQLHRNWKGGGMSAMKGYIRRSWQATRPSLLWMSKWGVIAFIAVLVIWSPYRHAVELKNQMKEERDGYEIKIEKQKTKIEEQGKLIAGLQTALDELKEPKFQAWIVGINIIAVEPSANQTFAIFVVSVANTGAPSMADSWEGEVALSDGRIIRGKSLAIHDKKVLSTLKRLGITYSSNDALYKKALKEPIQRGSKITGILMFSFDGIAPLKFPPNGAKLTFKDVNGKEYVAINNPKAVSAPRHFYGLEE